MCDAQESYRLPQEPVVGHQNPYHTKPAISLIPTFDNPDRHDSNEGGSSRVSFHYIILYSTFAPIIEEQGLGFISLDDAMMMKFLTFCWLTVLK